MLGPPDRVSYGEGWSQLKKFPPPDAIYETWYYAFYDLRVLFEREKIETEMETITQPGANEDESDFPRTSVSRVVGSGGWRMIPDFKVIDMIEEAKLRMISPQYRGGAGEGLRFKAKYVGGCIKITIPADKVIFVEVEGKLELHMLVTINVNRGSEKESEISEKKIISFFEDEVLQLKEVVLEVPYTPAQQGEYAFEVTVADLKAEYLSKYTQVFRHVFR